MHFSFLYISSTSLYVLGRIYVQQGLHECSAVFFRYSPWKTKTQLWKITDEKGLVVLSFLIVIELDNPRLMWIKSFCKFPSAPSCFDKKAQFKGFWVPGSNLACLHFVVSFSLCFFQHQDFLTGRQHSSRSKSANRNIIIERALWWGTVPKVLA